MLNRHRARYLIVGGHACVLHGLVRTTEDVDILTDDAEDNFERVIAALSEMEDHAAAELTPGDLKEKVVVKVADEVDVCAFDKAQGIHRGLPYVGLEHIESTTARFIGSSATPAAKSSTFRFSEEHVLYGRLRPYLNKALLHRAFSGEL